MTDVSLLPDNATSWEQELSLASAARRPVDADLVRRVRDPWACTVEILPFLAHSVGVRLWFSNWSEFRKRSMIADAIRLRRLEGTLAGAEGYLGYVDATVRRAVRPPSKTFLCGGLTDADREAWIARLAQIRFYPFDVTGTAPAARAFLRRRAFLGSMFLGESRGTSLYGRRATYRLPGGAEVPAIVDEMRPLGGAPAEQVRFDLGPPRSRTFLGHAFLRGAWLRSSRAGDAVVTVRLSVDAAGAFVVPTGLVVQDVRPVRVFTKRVAPVGRFFLGRDHLGARRHHLRPSAGPRMIHDRIAVLDPKATGAPVLRRGRSFVGRTRLGIRPHTAELLLDLPMTRSRWRAGLGRGAFLGRYLRPADMEPVRRVRTALAAAKAVDDRLLFDAAPFRTITLGDAPRLGTFTLGQLVRRF